jgi:hypothetical protein
MEVTTDKLIALGVAVCFCIVCWIHMWLTGTLSAFLLPPILLLMPLALIWFDDLLGSISGFTTRSPGYMNESPPIAIRLLGWLFLLGLIGFMVHGMVKG